jgi:hypothetical protein
MGDEDTAAFYSVKDGHSGFNDSFATGGGDSNIYSLITLPSEECKLVAVIVFFFHFNVFFSIKTS